MRSGRGMRAAGDACGWVDRRQGSSQRRLCCVAILAVVALMCCCSWCFFAAHQHTSSSCHAVRAADNDARLALLPSDPFQAGAAWPL